MRVASWALRSLTVPIRCEPLMFRWLIVVFLALVLINGLMPLLRRFGVGRLPGDFELRIGRRVIPVPLASTLVLSGLCSLLARYI